MKDKFKRSINRGFTDGIKYGKAFVLPLNSGTVLGEYYLPWIIGVLNGKRVEPPKHPFKLCPKCKKVYFIKNPCACRKESK